MEEEEGSITGHNQRVGYNLASLYGVAWVEGDERRKLACDNQAATWRRHAEDDKDTHEAEPGKRQWWDGLWDGLVDSQSPQYHLKKVTDRG